MAAITQSLSDPLRKAAKILQEGGIRHLLLRVLQKASSPLLEWGSVVFFMRNTAEELPEARAQVQLQMRFASPSDLSLLLDERDPSRSADTLRDRFQRGDLCFIALDAEGRVAHSRWLTTECGYIPELDMDVFLGAGEAYFYDGYTRPDLRGHRIDGVVRCFIFNWLGSAGFKRVYSYVRGDNPVGLKAAHRWQRTAGRIRYLRVRGFRPLIMRKQGRDRPLLMETVIPDNDKEERAFRDGVSRAWFQSWLKEPLSKRSTGCHAVPDASFVSTAEYISQALKLDPDSDFVLDVGCDSAMVSRLVARHCRYLVGVDFIQGMLADIPKESMKTASGDPACFASADGRRLPFRSRAFTKVYCSAVIHTLPTRQDGLKVVNELLRVCQPGGEVLVASIPDSDKRLQALLDIWKRAHLVGKLRLFVSLAIPRPAKNLLRRLLGLERYNRLILLDYDLKELRGWLEARGLECEILHFSENYWSSDFRRTRSNLLIRIPPAQRLPDRLNSTLSRARSADTAEFGMGPIQLPPLGASQKPLVARSKR